ncbi:ABC transporter substrate-binding protein [Candidatus Roizmanbacteria bacterium CG_4_9_14_3_um_filter_33_18]|uniref:ABC transporter substrate-binding protein n=4 Tax=Candidatus Roizmaniibacteriota TaxID=1752723 RepID=A0A2M7AVJ3_9BACT|nr:MAG: ABC transporter substrate-binding protein [Candidatus Roizmanbacteria bacterium CG07_land_8_20_14_0_80_34_15]PIU74664.1 MAG: ABC transporter substrate-binding protein [Candidatus Roizmanbacteria bacterium CG06_land_8_20_14_3_00_34_14]PIW73307.1 MAG: ABC transporter substrate-binding protein [Candidatus Roizmanbacteria bacterium CG_4_8_14_3_um_filter_34_9]PJA55122.1 MAG: ABC transporter substrate-binding protein [Candidatus Roizmanbacteria bacterium CG_4_9_14_3_um_filter_33_18]
MLKKIIVLVVVLIVLGFVFEKKISKPTESNIQKQKVTVLLDWFPNTNHTGLYVAREKGYFAKENLDVTILQPGEGENNQIVAAGKADFGISSQESVIQARVAGIPLVSIAAVIQHNTSAFASLQKSNIKTAKDFEGKRYGGWGSPIEETVIKAVMNEAGADYGKVKNITIGETDFFKTIGRDSDFQWIFYGWDGIEAKRRGIKLNTIMLKDLNPILDYYTPVIITNENHVKNQKEFVTKFMRAVAQGYKFSIKNPKEAAQILIKSAPELNKDLVKQSQVYLSQEYQSDAKKWGIEKEEVWKRYAQWLFDQKLIKKMINVKDAFTNEFLP